MPFDDSYNTVPERLEEVREKWPEGRLRPANIEEPFRVVEVDGKTFIAYSALFYRTPEDPLPGFGCAWEPFPGPTNFTRNSELQNAETSAWGRAMIAALVASAKKGIATREDVESRAGNVAQLEDHRPGPADKARHPAAQEPTEGPVLPQERLLGKAAREAGFGGPENRVARHDVLQAATMKRDSKELSPMEVKAALDAFEGLKDGSVEFGYDEEGVPTLSRVEGL